MGEIPTRDGKSLPHGSDVTLRWAPREMGESPPLEMVETQQDSALSNLTLL